MIKLRHRLPIIFVLLAGITLSGWGFKVVWNLESARAEAEFSRAASVRVAAIQRRIDTDIEVLHAIAAFYASSKFVSRDEFRSFVSPALARQGGIQALEWVPRIRASDRTAFEHDAHDDGFPGYRIHERDDRGQMVSAAVRPEYFPIRYVEPVAGNERTIGFDLASDPIQRAALAAARDSGQAVASAPITLVQENDDQRGFLVFFPIYATGQPDTTVEQRRESLVGFALGVFRVEDIIQAAIADVEATAAVRASRINLHFFDSDAPAEQRHLYAYRASPTARQTAPPSESATLTSTHVFQTLEVAGRRWNVVAKPAVPLLEAIGVWLPWATLAGGLAITMLLAAYLVTMLNRTRAIEHLAQSRTAELRKTNDELQRQVAEREATAAALQDQERMYRDLVAGSLQGILIYRDAKPLFANQAYAEMLGYQSPDEIKSLDSIAEQHSCPEHEPIEASIQAHEPDDAAHAQFEYEALRDDGKTVTLLGSNRLVDWNGQKATQRTVIDVTERKRAEERVRQVVESAPSGMVMIDATGTIVLVNAEAESIFGYSRDELLGESVETLVPERFREKHPSERELFLRDPCSRPMGSNRDLYGVRKDGTEFAIEIALNPIETDEGKMVLSAITDITARKKIDKMKNEFISTVSHELRTPLTSIMGSLGLIRSGTVGEIPNAAASMIQIAYNNSDRLVRLINDILDVEKIESGKLEFRVEPLEVDPIIGEAVSANTGFAEQSDVGFVVNNTLPDVRVRGDKDRLMQVLTNLLSNAVKFSPTGGDVEIGLSFANRLVRFEVTDHGPGIPEDFRAQIFQKFAQADSSDTRRVGGTGLGLSIAKAIVEHLGGTIGFDTVCGEGTTFFFELPGYMQRATPTGDRTHASPARVLVCEDDADVGALLALLLEKEGYQVDVALNAGEASRLASHNNYVAMTVDICLPEDSGIDLIKRLRGQEPTCNLPVIVVSAVATDRKDELTGEAFGVLDWLDKPIDQARLLESIRRATQSSGRRAQVLHVEDEEDVLEVVGAIVAPHAEVTAARTLRDARTCLEQNTYDLILLDLGLPDGSGEQLILELKDSEHATTPVVIFSAGDTSADIAGAVAEKLVKSRTSNEALATTIADLIRSHGAGEPPMETAA